MLAGAAPGSLEGGPAQAGPGGWRGRAAGAPQPPSGRPRRVGKWQNKPRLPTSDQRDCGKFSSWPEPCRVGSVSAPGNKIFVPQSEIEPSGSIESQTTDLPEQPPVSLFKA
ncbi:hypothetical protein R6Z07F_006507 [Ovis aries]